MMELGVSPHPEEEGATHDSKIQYELQWELYCISGKWHVSQTWANVQQFSFG